MGQTESRKKPCIGRLEPLIMRLKVFVNIGETNKCNGFSKIPSLIKEEKNTREAYCCKEQVEGGTNRYQYG
jgi:cobalamin-dependent methionine synthase I